MLFANLKYDKKDSNAQRLKIASEVILQIMSFRFISKNSH